MRVKSKQSKSRPLSGRRIVVTRARHQAGDFSQKLAELGADVLAIPAIKIAPPDNKKDIVDALLGLHAYNWLVFTSANGVTAFFDLFFRRFKDLRDLGAARLAAVGPATAAKVRELHLEVDVMPAKALGKEIAAAINKFESVENLKICLLRAAAANPDLPRALEELGAIVDDVAVYKTVAETEDPGEAGKALCAGGADWITFTSGSTVEHFHARFDLLKLLKQFPQTKLASLGPETTEAIRALGLAPALEAREHTTDSLIAALLKAI
jgi:uroporphyrinogen III methyltransferase / synthase